MIADETLDHRVDRNGRPPLLWRMAAAGHVAEAILASDWLAAHDTAARLLFSSDGASEESAFVAQEIHLLAIEEAATAARTFGGER